jgi:2-hydroxy-6-oxonona-2,4-dienedioate hydrolase
MPYGGSECQAEITVRRAGLLTLGAIARGISPSRHRQVIRMQLAAIISLASSSESERTRPVTPAILPTAGKEGKVSQDLHSQFRWREQGEGEAVLLLHGLLGDMEHWSNSLRVLSDFCRPIALTLPIFEPFLPEVSPVELCGWVRAFLDAQGIDRAVIGGNSLGGHVALELALAHPDRVSGLLLTGSSGLFERSFTRGVPHRPTPSWVRTKMEEVFYNPAMVTAQWVETVQRAVTTRSSVLRLLQAARAAKHHNMEARLPTIEAPTCIIWGADDRITPPEIADRFHALIPRSDLFLLSRCGHAPMLEQPEAFNRVLAGWLRRTGEERARLVVGGAR